MSGNFDLNVYQKKLHGDQVLLCYWYVIKQTQFTTTRAIAELYYTIYCDGVQFNNNLL